MWDAGSLWEFFSVMLCEINALLIEILRGRIIAPTINVFWRSFWIPCFSDIAAAELLAVSFNYFRIKLSEHENMILKISVYISRWRLMKNNSQIVFSLFNRREIALSFVKFVFEKAWTHTLPLIFFNEKFSLKQSLNFLFVYDSRWILLLKM